jgi:hypothetical protein
MKHSSVWTTTLAIGACLTTAAWGQHGAGGIHGAGGPPDSHATDKGPSSSATTHFETRLANNPSLSARLQPLLPANTTLQAAASGFKNQGQFIAALHVSHNLGIPFDQLKTEMTGSDRGSLGKAIQDLRPTLSSKTVHGSVKRADHQTKADLQESSEPNGN